MTGKTTKTTETPADAVAALDPATVLDPAPSADEYGKPDSDGHQWASRKEEGGVRVYLKTSTGQSLNTLTETEAKGKAALLAYLKEGN